MERIEHDKIIAFDTLFTNNHIQMLKVVMPYFDSRMQAHIAIFIKYLEFRYVLSFCQTGSCELCSCSIDKAMGKEDFDICKLCNDILPFCTKEEKQQIEQMTGIFRSMETFKEMSKMMELMKDLAPDMTGGTATGQEQNNNPDNGMLNMLMGMLSPEQQAMFQMFGGNNSHESE